jgi:hypothetical protein
MSSSQEAGALLPFVFGQRADLQALALLAGSLGRRPVAGLRLRQSRDPAFQLRKDERS